MLALAMSSTAPADSTQGVPGNTNKRSSENSEPASDMLALAPLSAPNKRPKLSLQTASLPITFGKSSTALALTASALPTASPTVLNTFNNAYDLHRRPSPATTPRLTQRLPRSMASVASRRDDEWPYKVPLGIRGILRNTPIPTSMRKSSVCSNSASPRTGRRVFFPPTKRVCYRFPLEEEITTVKFVARHSDLSSDESDSDSGPEAVSEELDDTLDLTTSDEDVRVQARPKKALKRYSRRQIRAAAVRDGLAEGRDPTLGCKTPADRKKRRRWEWTLGPLAEESVGSGTADLAAVVSAGDSTMPSQTQSIPDATDTPLDGNATTSAPRQASTPPPAVAEPPLASVGPPVCSPGPHSLTSSSPLPQIIPLPASPSENIAAPCGDDGWVDG